MEDPILRLRILYGIMLIILGIVTAIVTYRYVVPIGSILLIGSGLILICWKRWKYVISYTISGKEIK